MSENKCDSKGCSEKDELKEKTKPPKCPIFPIPNLNPQDAINVVILNPDRVSTNFVQVSCPHKEDIFHADAPLS